MLDKHHVSLVSLALLVACASATVVLRADAQHGDEANTQQGDGCQPSPDRDTILDYEYIVHCSFLQHFPIAGRALLVFILVLLLYMLSSTADSFFSPVLQSMVAKYRIPPAVAGVTFLSFGNGSPDVFANIAAFVGGTPGIGITAVFCGGLLLTTVVAGCVGLASQGQDQLVPRQYVRDVLFYLIGLAYASFILLTQDSIGIPAALGFLGIYILFVCTVFMDNKIAMLLDRIKSKGRRDELDALIEDHTTSSHALHSSRDQEGGELSPSNNLHAFSMGPGAMYDTFDLTRADSEDSTASSTYDVNRRSSVPTQPSSRRAANNSETQTLLEDNTQDIQRSASITLPSLHRRRRRRRQRNLVESVQRSYDHRLASVRWTRSYHHLKGIDEFAASRENSDSEDEEEGAGTPTGQNTTIPEVEDEDDSSRDSGAAMHIDEVDVYKPSRPQNHEHSSEMDAKGHGKQGADSGFNPGTIFKWFEAYVWGPFEFVTTFIRRLTIPLVDDETWNKSFSMLCPPVAILMCGLVLFNISITNLWFVGAVIIGGGGGSVYVWYFTDDEDPPDDSHLIPQLCLAFIMSVVWIRTIAQEVLGVLQTLGDLFHIPSAVLGASVLSWGNTLGDLASDTSIARDGFPSMAFAGCFAGPFFNLMVGMGAALLIANVADGPVVLDHISPVVYVSICFLAASLVLNLVGVILGSFKYMKTLSISVFTLYSGFLLTVIAVVVF